MSMAIASINSSSGEVLRRFEPSTAEVELLILAGVPGNVGLLKPASNVPQCALAIEEIFHEAGFPEGVFQTLLIESKDVQRLLDDPRVAAVTLTGSEGAGNQVPPRLASKSRKPC